MEPLVVALAAKIASAMGGLMGGMAVFSFLKPTSLKDAAIRGGVSTGSAILATFPVMRYLGMNPYDWEISLSMGGLIGFVAWFALSAVAQTLKRTEGMDVFEVSRAVKNKRIPVKSKRKIIR